MQEPPPKIAQDRGWTNDTEKNIPRNNFPTEQTPTTDPVIEPGNYGTAENEFANEPSGRTIYVY